MILRRAAIAGVLWLAAAAANAQNDSTRYINGIPVSDDDTVQNFPKYDFDPPEKLVAVTADDLPGDVRTALENGDQYQGWRDTLVYHDLNTGLYLVPVRYQDGIRIFGLNKNGDPVTFDEVSDTRK